jgi:2-polyprenyl-3-methyl-5-hydroxy-6-metoxy-1,4-benzoquinol methylase
VEEGVLLCDQCAALFPVLGGVVLWLPDSRTYLLKRYAELQSLVANSGLMMSDRMRQFVDGFAPALQSVGFTPESWESDAGIQIYKRAQFGALLPRLKSSRGLANIESMPGYRDFYERCLDLIGPWCNLEHQAVDIGCGVGGFTYRLAKLSSRVLGMDYSLKAAHTARRLLSAHSQTAVPNPSGKTIGTHTSALATPEGEIEIIAGDITSMPLRANTFDVAVSLNVIEVLREPESLIRAAAKTVKLDGVFLLTTCFYWRVDRCDFRKWLPAAPDVERCLIKYGFKVLEHHENVPWVLPMTERYTQLWDADIFLTKRTT